MKHPEVVTINPMVSGIITHENTGCGLQGLQVSVFPTGWIDWDDCLGKAITDRKGAFRIELDKSILSRGTKPDCEFEIIIRVTKPNGWIVHESRGIIEKGQDLKLEIYAPQSKLGGQHVVSGTVYDARSCNTLGNLFVEVWDEDFIMNDFLGSATTDLSGHYRVSFERDEFHGVLDMNPDVYIKVKNKSGMILHRSLTRKEVGNNTIIDARIDGIELAGRVSDGIYQWKTFYNQEGTHVSIRIRLVPDSSINADELVSLREKWKKGIEDIWSGCFACCCESDKALSDCSRPARLTFEVQWVEKNPHYIVNVRKGPAVSNMLLWDTEDSEAIVAHHFGHMLGLEDEYYDPSCPLRSPVETGTIMDDGRHVVRRHVEHLCQFLNQFAAVIPHRGVSDDFVPVIPQVAIDPDQATSEEIARVLKAITSGKMMLEEGDKITHRVFGGFLSDRYEWFLEILHNGRVTLIFRDQIRGENTEFTISLDSSSMMRLIREIIASGISKSISSSHGYLPDSLVGCFALDIRGLRKSWFFLASPIQRRMQRMRMGKSVATVNRLMKRVAEMVTERGI